MPEQQPEFFAIKLKKAPKPRDYECPHNSGQDETLLKRLQGEETHEQFVAEKSFGQMPRQEEAQQQQYEEYEEPQQQYEEEYQEEQYQQESYQQEDQQYEEPAQDYSYDNTADNSTDTGY